MKFWKKHPDTAHSKIEPQPPKPNGVFVSTTNESLRRVRKQLLKNRLENVKGDWFVPTMTIRRILDKPTVQSLLDESHNHREWIMDRVSNLVDVAQREYPNTLAVLVYIDLVHLIVDLVAAPHSLPVDRKYLSNRCFPEEKIDVFLDNQYHFLEVNMCIGTDSPTVYNDERLILPICSRGSETRGAFGAVQEVSVHDTSVSENQKVCAMFSVHGGLLLKRLSSLESDCAQRSRRKLISVSFGTSAFCQQPSIRILFLCYARTRIVANTISFSLWQETEILAIS